MYLEDAPVMELSPRDKTLFKKVINGTLFKEVAFYSSLEEVNHIMGYIGHKELQRRIMINYLERAKLALGCCVWICLYQDVWIKATSVQQMVCYWPWQVILYQIFSSGILHKFWIYFTVHLVVQKKPAPDWKMPMESYIIAYKNGISGPKSLRRNHLVHIQGNACSEKRKLDEMEQKKLSPALIV